jgi:hypothetical protein
MFYQDKLFGDEQAEKILKMLGIPKEKTRRMLGHFKEFDYICCEGDQIVLREMKSDRIAHVSGNIVIECMYRGQPSGIQTTAADYWNYYIPGNNKLYNIPVPVLKGLIQAQEYVEIKKVGDDTIVYLFKQTTLDPFLVPLPLKPAR